MNSLTLIFAAACVFAIAYRFYGLFLANKVLNLRDERVTPAETYADGHDYVKTNKYVLFGMSNQLLAICALIVGTTMLIRLGKAMYAWVTAGPGLDVVAHEPMLAGNPLLSAPNCIFTPHILNPERPEYKSECRTIAAKLKVEIGQIIE